MAELRAVTLGSSGVLWLTRPEPLRAAAEAVLGELGGTGKGDLGATWTRYEATRAAARWKDQREVPFVPFLREALGSASPEPSDLESRVAERLASSMEWYPDALPGLDYLRESGYRTALLLDLPLPLSRAWQERIRPWFDVTVSSLETGLRTPSAAVFAEAVRRLHAVPARTLHVGDGLAEDVHGAQRAGLRAALLERPQRHAPDPASLEWLRGQEGVGPTGVQPDVKLRSLEELAAAIDAFG